IAGQRFGSLRVIRLLKKRDKFGRWQWLCKCDCGRKTCLDTGRLRGGHTRSCGCQKDLAVRAYRFTRREAGKAHKDRENLVVDGRQWSDPQKGVGYVNESSPPLVGWANLDESADQKGSPWLGGRAIRARPMTTAYNRQINYFLKDDLDKVLDAKAERPQV